jgi:hypothetical protein
MGKAKSLDAINREILRVLSLYEQLSLLELWFEIGEARVLGPVTKEQVSGRLESLKAQGFVERILLGEGNIRWTLKWSSKRGEFKGMQMFQEAGGSQGEYVRREEGERR